MVAGLQRGEGSLSLAIDSSPSEFDIDPEIRGMCAFPANLGINDGKCQGGVSPLLAAYWLASALADPRVIDGLLF